MTKGSSVGQSPRRFRGKVSGSHDNLFVPLLQIQTLDNLHRPTRSGCPLKVQPPDLYPLPRPLLKAAEGRRQLSQLVQLVQKRGAMLYWNRDAYKMSRYLIGTIGAIMQTLHSHWLNCSVWHQGHVREWQMQCGSITLTRRNKYTLLQMWNTEFTLPIWKSTLFKQRILSLRQAPQLSKMNVLGVYVVQDVAKNLTLLSHQDLIYKMTEIMSKSSREDWHLNLARRLGLNFNDLQSLRSGSRIVSKNFYTVASLKPRKSSTADHWDVKKVLIDVGSTLNLISQRVASQIGCHLRKDTSMTMIIANGARVPLPGYTVMEITVAGVARVVQFFVVPGKTTYSIILGRSWLRDVSAIGRYEVDEYWIKGSDGNYHMLEVSGGQLQVMRSPWEKSY